MSMCKCVTNPDIFYYICENDVILKQTMNITDFMKKAPTLILKKLAD